METFIQRGIIPDCFILSKGLVDLQGMVDSTRNNEGQHWPCPYKL